MRILGISAFYHDSAAALLVDGKIVAAAQEERFTRRKHDPGFPACAIRYCLAEAKIKASEIDHVVFYEKPFLKFERLLETYLAFAPRGFQSFRKAIPVWLKEKLFQKSVLRDHLGKSTSSVDWEAKLLFADHHQSHAASAFFASPFSESAILTLDGVGEWTTTSAGYGRDNTLDLTREINFPHSIGLLYSAFTYYTGFKVNSGEYKVMGLAPYGEPKYASLILEHLVDLREDGSFRLDLDYFDYCTGLTMTNGRFDALFGGKPRDPSERLEQRHMDLAASVQQVTEEIVLRLTRSLAREGLSENLCLAGGVALNCVANGKILRERTFKNIWVQPAAGDAGGAIGAALAAYHQFAGRPRTAPAGDAMAGGYLGPSFSQSEIEQRLRAGRCGIHGARRRRNHSKHGQGAGCGESGWLVSGTNGVRPAGAGCALHSRRSPIAAHAELAQSAGQISRKLPSVRAGRVARGRGRLVRSRRRQSLHADRRRRAGKTPAARQSRRRQAVRYRAPQCSRDRKFRP